MGKPREIINASFERIVESFTLGVFDLLHTGVAFFCEKGYFVYCNNSFLQMYSLPESVIGKHITEYFLTGEQGVMSSIRTRKMVICLSQTTHNVYGVSFRYPIYDYNNIFRGVIVESIPMNLGKEKLVALFESVRSLEMKSYSPEMKDEGDKSGLHSFESLVGESAPMEALRNLGRRFAVSREPVLISGESGTGKEMVAQALHMSSARVGGPFISVNCAALPHELIESELFGYEAGAFTGARSGGMKGKFEQADGGTIFLDEIGELPLPLQAKLLRVLESGEIQKIAYKGRLRSDFRLIGATNRNLPEMVRQGEFREDLYHRLSVFELDIPPLRERGDDIFLLTRHYIRQYLGEERGKALRLDEELRHAFRRYPWRGNIRELKNTLVYALYSLGEDQEILEIRHLPQRFIRKLQDASTEQEASTEGESERGDNTGVKQSLYMASSNTECKVLRDALARLRYNKVLVAQELGISRSKLYRKLRKYGLLSKNEQEHMEV